MSFVIKRESNGVPTFFSPATGRKFGQPLGGWVNTPDAAMLFARQRDAEEFVDCFMGGQQGNVRVSPV